MTTEMKREKRVRFGSVEVAVAMPDAKARRIAQSALYRKALRPAATWMTRQLSARAKVNGNGASHNSDDLPMSPPRPEDLDPEARRIIELIAPIEWYHSIDLGHGVITPGFVDHRAQVAAYGLPESLSGKRCLDVATWDGFWAFEMERRGADEVVALDVGRWADCDLPRLLLDDLIKLGADRETGQGFKAAHQILGSKVRREICNVYDLSPERFGQFDFIFLSDLLLHLRDPQRALEHVLSVCREQLIVADVYNPMLEGYGDLCLTQFAPHLINESWWLPNTNTLKMMMTIAGFEPVEETARLVLNTKAWGDCHKVVLKGSVPKLHSWRARLPTPEEAATRSRGWESQAWQSAPGPATGA